MATITKVCRKSGDAYKAMIRLRGVKPFSKTFKLKKDAKVWANRMERDIDEARAYGNRALLPSIRVMLRNLNRLPARSISSSPPSPSASIGTPILPCSHPGAVCT
jgi:hypothetical protein